MCAMRRFCLIGFLLPIYNMFGLGGAQVGFRTQQITMQTAQFRYVLV
jgi:hypothetical protein